MRLVSYEGGFGRVDGDFILPMGRDLVAYLASGRAEESKAIARSSVRLLAPVPKPEKVICVGLNYRDHATETGQPIPEEPVLFAKFANSVLAPGAPIAIPRSCEQVDYEAELAVVIGRTARDVSASDALSYVAGYTAANDVSARDLQFRTSQWTRGKAIDDFLPLGPWIVTSDEIPDPQALSISCTVSGERLQSSTTAQMIFGVAELVSFISQTMTLVPGDIISTGTPPGVGAARKPQRFLREGDTVTVEIEKIGALTNSVRKR